jgi:hypothetical protein
MTEAILQQLITNAQTPTGGVFVLSFIILAFGIPLMTRLGANAALAANALQVLAIIPQLCILGSRRPLTLKQ